MNDFFSKRKKTRKLTSCAHLGSVWIALVSRSYGVKVVAGDGCELLSLPSTATFFLFVSQIEIEYLIKMNNQNENENEYH